MPDWATSDDRARGLAHIQSLREQHRLRPEAKAPVKNAESHDPAGCDACLGHWCFWCDRAGLPNSECRHTVSARHGAPLPERKTAEPAVAGDVEVWEGSQEPAADGAGYDGESGVGASWPDEPSEEA